MTMMLHHELCRTAPRLDRTDATVLMRVRGGALVVALVTQQSLALRELVPQGAQIDQAFVSSALHPEHIPFSLQRFFGMDGARGLRGRPATARQNHLYPDASHAGTTSLRSRGVGGGAQRPSLKTIATSQ